MPKTSEIIYSLCPVGSAGFISSQKGFLTEGLNSLNVKATLLQSLPRERHSIHYTYEDDAFLREGGNTPPMWAKSRGADPVLVGLMLTEWRTYIITRTDLPIDSVEQLRGRRVGIPVSRNPWLGLDWFSATTRFAFETAFAARGVSPGEAEFIELDAPFEPFDDRKDRAPLNAAAVSALEDKRVDAIFTYHPRSPRLLDTGKYKIIFDFHADKSILMPYYNDHPIVLTASRKLAEESPDIVTEYVKRDLAAAEWAKTHSEEVIELFAKQMSSTPGEIVNSYTPGFHTRLSINLDNEGLWALEAQKKHLFDAGIIERDFDLSEWADGSFLKEAQRQLEAEKDKKTHNAHE